MKQSFLINDRIYLRAVEPEDMDVMYEMENDPSMWDPVTYYDSTSKVLNAMFLPTSSYV